MTGHLSCTIIIGKNADRGNNNERSTAPGKDLATAPWGQRTHELRGNLNLASRYDVDTFITQAANTPECLLSRMTGGVHLHTLRCPDEETFQRIEAALREKGILY